MTICDMIMHMVVCNMFGPQFGFGIADWNRIPDNENLRLLPDWMTPAELLQWIRQEREVMRKELAADFRLRSDPKHRNDWDNLEALERATLQQGHGGK